MTSAREAGKPDRDDASVGELLSELSEELRRLARAEVRLALTDARRKAKRAAAGGSALAMTAAFGAAALGVLAASATLAVAQALPGWLAALLIGVGFLLLAGMTALFARIALRRALPPVSPWLANSVREDVETIARGVRR